MNNIVTIICGLLTILSSLGTAFFVYGRLTEKVQGHGRRIGVLEENDRRHEGEIGELYGMAGASRHKS